MTYMDDIVLLECMKEESRQIYEDKANQGKCKGDGSYAVFGIEEENRGWNGSKSHPFLAEPVLQVCFYRKIERER